VNGRPWGVIRKSWPEVVVVTQPPEEKLSNEWMEHLMPKNMGIVRPDKVLVVGAVEDYMTVENKVWEKSPQHKAMNLLPG
jgi:hypothetical protein